MPCHPLLLSICLDIGLLSLIILDFIIVILNFYLLIVDFSIFTMAPLAPATG